MHITTSNSHHLRDGSSVGDNANEGIMHTMLARIARFRIREWHYAAQGQEHRKSYGLRRNVVNSSVSANAVGTGEALGYSRSMQIQRRHM